ncbi:MAG: hypothetical protein NT169_26210 [Chloroflexi bacterium]|nr:hypothetical protein [Chloroflexota bacterium]
MKVVYTNYGPISKRARFLLQLVTNTLRSMGKQKVFCIGKNKTGTTSMARAFSELGLVVGAQSLAERLLHDWARRDFRRLFLYCHTAQAFQDVPFSLPYTFQALDQRFPGSKFILTMRDSPEQWYNSLTRFHAALFGHGRIPTAEDLKAARYVYPGFMYEANRLLYSTPEDDLYNRDALIAGYNAHNNAVLAYFRHRPEDLLVLNVAEPGAYDKLCRFLERPCVGKDFPWENRTANIENKSGTRSSYDVKGQPFMNTEIYKQAPS